MNHHTTHPERSALLRSAVAQAYEVFGRYSAPQSPMSVCTSCCMSQKMELEMRQLPLRQLTAAHFYEYNTAVWLTTNQLEEEVKYLLPRWLELLADGCEIHHSPEHSLLRVGRCRADSFSAAERAVLDQFMLRYLERSLDHGGYEAGLTEWIADPLTVLQMAHLGGIAVSPLLAHWLSRTDAPSTVSYVDWTYWDFWAFQELSNSLARDEPAFDAVIKQWLVDPANRRAFANKMLQPEFQQLAQQQPDYGAVSFAVMAKTVFDHLTD